MSFGVDSDPGLMPQALLILRSLVRYAYRLTKKHIKIHIRQIPQRHNHCYHIHKSLWLYEERHRRNGKNRDVGATQGLLRMTVLPTSVVRCRVDMTLPREDGTGLAFALNIGHPFALLLVPPVCGHGEARTKRSANSNDGHTVTRVNNTPWIIVQTTYAGVCSHSNHQGFWASETWDEKARRYPRFRLRYEYKS